MAWQVPNMWEGGECWIIGGGASIPKQFGVPDDLIEAVVQKTEPMSAFSPYLAPIHDKHCIGINVAFLLGDWIEIAFFGDQGFFLKNRKELAKFKGLKVTCYPGLNNAQYQHDHLKHLARDRNKTQGISNLNTAVCWNGNSGAAAISLAANAGAKRIILLGFDMKLSDQSRAHFHSEYAHGKPESVKNRLPHTLPFSRHMLCFDEVSKDAKKRGIEIINASPDSAIEQFPKVPVKELL